MSIVQHCASWTAGADASIANPGTTLEEREVFEDGFSLKFRSSCYSQAKLGAPVFLKRGVGAPRLGVQQPSNTLQRVRHM